MGKITKIESFPGLPVPSRAKSYVMGAHPKGGSFLYCTEKAVIIRDVEDIKKNFQYTEHQKRPTVAKYSPSGNYICSGDAGGNVRIWDTTQETHILKYKYQPLSGIINDIAWTEDNMRLAVCGEGRQSYASAFLWNSGSSVGTLDKMEKHCNSVALKPNRPFRCAVASEDYSTYFYQGPPFKHNKTLEEGTNFCNCVRFSPDGKILAVANSNGHVYLYDGKEGQLIGELLDGEKAHNGGVYSLDFSPDSTEIVTSSGDKCIKVWDIATKSLSQASPKGTSVDDQILSCLWMKGNILTVSLSGDIKIFESDDILKANKVLSGHKKNITAVCVGKENFIYSASFDAVLIKWNSLTGETTKFTGQGHSNSIVAMEYSASDNNLVTISMDDTLRITPLGDEDKWNSVGSVSTKLASQPSSLSLSGSIEDYAIVGCQKELCLIKNGKVVSTVINKCFPVYTSITKQGHVAATTEQTSMGGIEKQSVKLYEVVEGKLQESSVKIETNMTSIGSLQYSPDGVRLAVANNKEILVFNVNEQYKQVQRIQGSSTRITGIKWSSDNRHLASYTIDCSIFVWDAIEGKHKAKVSSAHTKANVSALSWMSSENSDIQDIIVSVGSDCCVNQWKVEF